MTVRVIIPSEVEVQIQSPSILFSGPRGSLRKNLSHYKDLSLKIEGNVLLIDSLQVKEKERKKSIHSLAAKLERDALSVLQPHEITLELKGLGYRWSLKNQELTLHLGKSHEDIFIFEDSIRCVVRTPTELSLIGVDKENLSQVAEQVCRLSKRDAYKGKGIFRKGESVVLKERKQKS